MSLTDAFGTDIAHQGDLMRNSSGDIDLVTGLANIQQALYHRLLTVPGTLAHRPTYGVGAPLFQNAISSFIAQQKFASVIQEQFALDPRVEEVTTVAIEADDTSPQLTRVKVFVKLIGYSDGQEMTFTPFSGGV